MINKNGIQVGQMFKNFGVKIDGPTPLIMLDQNGSDTVGIFVLTDCKCCDVVGGRPLDCGCGQMTFVFPFSQV